MKQLLLALIWIACAIHGIWRWADSLAPAPDRLTTTVGVIATAWGVRGGSTASGRRTREVRFTLQQGPQVFSYLPNLPRPDAIRHGVRAEVGHTGGEKPIVWRLSLDGRPVVGPEAVLAERRRIGRWMLGSAAVAAGLLIWQLLRRRSN